MVPSSTLTVETNVLALAPCSHVSMFALQISVPIRGSSVRSSSTAHGVVLERGSDTAVESKLGEATPGWLLHIGKTGCINPPIGCINPPKTWWCRCSNTPRWLTKAAGSRNVDASWGKQAPRCWTEGPSQARKICSGIMGTCSWTWGTACRWAARKAISANKTISNPISVRGAIIPRPPNLVGSLACVHWWVEIGVPANFPKFVSFGCETHATRDRYMCGVWCDTTIVIWRKYPHS